MPAFLFDKMTKQAHAFEVQESHWKRQGCRDGQLSNNHGVQEQNLRARADPARTAEAGL